MLIVALLAACAEEDPEATRRDGGATDAGGGQPSDGGGATDGDGAVDCGDYDFPGNGDNADCESLAGNYQPGADDDWPTCISDDGEYHPFQKSVSSTARVAAFEEIAELLFAGETPSAEDFTDARLAYAVDEGLDSRVARREDEHYPPAPEACRDLTPEEQQEYADRCVGPARIQPILNDAFARGMSGEEPRENAARIEAALLWFLYLSVHKEATTCTTTPADCDSSWAYYTGGEPIEEPLGLGRAVHRHSEQAHHATFDGILAVRCWRDLDNPTGPAEDLDLRDAAIGQMDRALLRGVALLVRARFERLARACEDERPPLWAFLQILGPVLDREASARDEDAAGALRDELARDDPNAVDTAAAISAIDAIFPCP